MKTPLHTKFVAIMFCLVTSIAFAQRQTVTIPIDGLPGSLRSVVSQANPGDTIDFDSSLDGSELVLTLGLINIDKALVFEGNGQNSTIISGASNNQIFNINGADSISLLNLTLQNGLADIQGGAINLVSTNLSLSRVAILNSVANGPEAKNGGGAIYAKDAFISIADSSIFDGNIADGASGSGGALMLDSAASVSINDSYFMNNSSSRAGGAIESNTGGNTLIEVDNTLFEKNSTGGAPGNGGAVHITGLGDMTVIESRFDSNLAVAEGGALWNGAGEMLISNCSFSGNIAEGDASSNGGGALFNLRGLMTVNNGSRIIDNHATGASGSGGAIFNDSAATLVIDSVFISHNTANRAGGGIEDQSGPLTTMTFTRLYLDSNEVFTSPGNGGGLHITGLGNVTITGGHANGNIAGAEGGALWNGAGSMVVDSFDMDGNIANGKDADQGGGAVYNLSGSFEISNASILNNRVDSGSASGGGILNDVGGSLTLNNVVFDMNSARRAGGAVEDNSGAASEMTFTNVTMNNNYAGPVPGNGGGLHITGPGNVTITGGEFTNNVAFSEGGALWNGAGEMTVSNALLSNNKAQGKAADQGGGAIYNLSGVLSVFSSELNDNSADSASASGGAILNDVGATLVVQESTFSNNFSKRAGGAIEDNSGAMGGVTLSNNVFDSNKTMSSPGNGGAFHITGPGNATITGDVYTNNEAAAEGGAVWNGAGNMTITNVTIANNKAHGKESNQGGGGIYNLSGQIVLSESMIMNNAADSASGSGGGILNDVGASLSILNTTIKGNTSKRAGGGIEDVSGAGSEVILQNVILDSNITMSSPGNGGAIHITGDGNMTIVGGSATGNIASAEGGAFWNGLGEMIVSGVTFESNIANGILANQGGGAIYNLRGSLTVDNSIFLDNHADSLSGSGGAILNDSAATMVVSNSTFELNTASRAGGAIEDVSGNSTVSQVFLNNFIGNSTGTMPGNGGAIHITGNGDMIVAGGEFNNNVAGAEGGALWNGTGSMQVFRVGFDNNEAKGDGADQGGGAIYSKAGVLAISGQSIFSNNKATGTSGSGGAILTDIGTSLSVDSASFRSNTANRAGGAIEDNSGADSLAIIVNSEFLDNEVFTAPGNGGAIHITGPGDMILARVIATGNKAGNQGGAFWNGSGTMQAIECSIENNAAPNGGGLYNNGGTLLTGQIALVSNSATEAGGGIFNKGLMGIFASTISANTTEGNGGAVFNNGTFQAVSNTFALNIADGNGGVAYQENSSDTLVFGENLLFDNTASAGRNFMLTTGFNASLGYNLIDISVDQSFNTVEEDILGTAVAPIDVKVEALDDNGGFTKTHALLDGSPALNAALPTNMEDDQRGEAVAFGRRDIGAFECQDCSAISVNENTTDENKVNIYPNPSFGDAVNIELEKEAEVLLINAQGQTINRANGNKIRFNTKDLKPGVYYLNVISDNKTQNYQLMKL